MIKLSIKGEEDTRDTDECAICGKKMVDSTIDLGLFLADSWDPVCWDCGDWLAPQLVRILRLMCGEDSQEMDEHKLMKLEEYAGNKLVVFDRFDAFKGIPHHKVAPNANPGRKMNGDKDGDFLSHDVVGELASECGAVRILVTRGTKPEDALRLITKLLEMIKANARALTVSESPTDNNALSDELIDELANAVDPNDVTREVGNV
jgi:hypothetical protein